MILLSSCIGVLYALVIGALIKGIYISKPFLAVETSEHYCYSILIALRNEKENLPSLFTSLKTLSYNTQKFEIIFINDHSDDGSYEQLIQFQKENIELDIQCLQNIGNGKKNAITLGVNTAKHDWILTTDADCILPKKWIAAYDTLLQKENLFYISGPVALKKERSFLHQFQEIEFLGLQGTTIGSFAIGKPFMSNGANSCYQKQLFQKTNGYDGNQNISSGDDVFLLEKIRSKHPEKTGFINSRDAIVLTYPESSWRSLFNQKIRWAAKATLYKNKIGIFIGGIVFITNLLLILLCIIDWKVALLLYAVKLIADTFLASKAAVFFQQKIKPSTYLKSSLLYPFFSVTVFILSQIRGFEWKGRALKK